MGCLCPNHMKFQLTEELSLMALKNDAKFKEELIGGFKYDMRSLVNFHPTTEKSENIFSMSSFCPKYSRCWLQNEELFFMTLNSDAKVE